MREYLPQCGRLLTQLKAGLLHAGLLVPHEHLETDDLVVTRHILEMGSFWSIRTQEVSAFDRYFSQLQTFYNDFTTSTLIRGLQLIRLLTQNLIADFHTALEGLQATALESPYITHVINLERWLMEGNYGPPAPKCRPLSIATLSTFSWVRFGQNEISSCQETAYYSLTVKAAAALMFFPSQSEFLVFAQERQWDLDLDLGKITFAKPGDDATYIPKEGIINASLSLARELEQIV
ncbi:hypothetical protein B0H14DRAFT_3440940 [Mycena olivaceomarginata]|nr:hypothetical protein B0H14DRAFT_3440940 [Mycena olivaceomarginata]